MFQLLFERLNQIEEITEKSKFQESWSYISFEGSYIATNKVKFEDLYNEIISHSIQNTVRFNINNKPKSNFQDFIDEIQPNDKWSININKNAISIDDTNKCKINFFYSIPKLIEWAKNTNPFKDDYPFNPHKYKVYVNKLESDFGGSNFVFCKNQRDFVPLNWDNFDISMIENNVHIINQEKSIINPLNHFISFGRIDEVSKFFYRNSIIILLSCLCNEIKDDNEIILRGFRRIPLVLGMDYFGDEINENYQELLGEAVKWTYQNSERCDLRLKLLLERITLDLDLSIPLIQGLYSIIKDATTQAKERYSFIIYDRKDLYHKELKDLLKDIKNLTDSFSSKVRSLLSNLLRDVLAAIVLIGITLFTRTSDIEKLFENNLIKYVFIAFSIYFLVSGLLQLIVDTIDVCKSYKEFNYWQKITNEYMTKQEFKRHKQHTINGRLWVSVPSYLFLFALYLGISFLCYNFPCIWNYIINN